LTRLVEESGKLFGTRHYRDYRFMLTLSDHVLHFGLEHHESNNSRLPERALLSPNAGVSIGYLLGHEFAHSWNGKYRRPKDLATADYEQPMRDDLLWSYEGFTDYLGPLLAVRSGLFTVEQYREYLAVSAALMGPGRPGRTWRPLIDTAVAFPGFGYDSRGWMNWKRGADYYDEGNLLWLDVATTIMRESNDRRSIDDFCRLFYGGTNNGSGVETYNFDDLISALNTTVP
jgi:predicted metalloprotease with PDZ domain